MIDGFAKMVFATFLCFLAPFIIFLLLLYGFVLLGIDYYEKDSFDFDDDD